MKLRRLINILGILIILVLAILGIAHDNSVAVAQTGIDKLEPTLVDQFSTQGTADFIVLFSEQADLSAAYSMDWDTRGEYVYNTLRDTAAKNQANAIALLEKAGLKYESFIAGNELYIWGGTLEQADKLAGLSEVNSIEAARTYSIDPGQVIKPLEKITWAGDLLARHALTTVTSSTQAVVDWGITDTKANAFWANYGVRGDGIVVASIDTGVQWNHPALDQAYKCASNPSSSACWKDPTNIPCGSPCDNNGHGTHTMGTMVGDDDPSLSYIVGMAPNAKWIACRGCETDTCTSASLLACADWILAPGGSPANRPNVVNNSWGGGSGETWFRTAVQSWVAAGIFPAFSAGNGGPVCSTLSDPGDYQESFGSAAHDSSRNIATFSSRGPSSAFGDFPYTKPNISAPGVNIISTIPGNNWGTGSGTSMASPHTAGAVALLWSCNPTLKGKIDATFQLLQNNADPAPAGTCGTPLDGQGNYTYGYGYLDVLSAGAVACWGNMERLYLPVVFRSITNQNPTDILLSNSILQENQPINTVVGTISSSDPDIGNTFGYSLVSGSGSTDNGFFNISENQLRSSAVFDYETRSSYSIRIRTTDQGGLSFEKSFSITVTSMTLNPIVNGDFEQGHVGWTEYSTHGYPLIMQAPDLPITPYDGAWASWLGGDYDETSYIQQQVVVPASQPYLSYWHWIASNDYCGYDFGGVKVNATVVDEYSLCNENNTGGWVQRVINLSTYAGQTVSIQINAVCDSSLNSNLFIDQVAFQSTAATISSHPGSIRTIDASITKSEILDK